MRGGGALINIVLDVPKIYEKTLSDALAENGNFRIAILPEEKSVALDVYCRQNHADMALMAVSVTKGYTIEERKSQLMILGKENNRCKQILIADERMDEKINCFMKYCRKLRMADQFFYYSVGAEYIAESLEAMYD